MPNTPPPSKGNSPSDKPKVSVQQQLDELLVKIETEEPGTLDPNLLPSSFRAEMGEKTEQAEPKPAPEATPKPEAKSETPSEQPEAPADQAAIESAEDPTKPAEPEPTEDQAAMLAALNSALQDMNPGSKQDSGADAAAQTEEPTTASSNTAEELSPDEKLQQEIAALINSEPEVSAEATKASESSTVENELSTEDQIAMEIEGLLNTDQQAAPEPSQPQQEVDKTSIDELDQMLANEIDEDDELSGDFHTVEAITAGIEPAEAAALTADDEHAASARDVAAELDTQPEELISRNKVDTSSGEDPLAAIAEIAQVAEKNEREYQANVRLSLPVWVRRLKDAKERLLSICFVLNWPARRFLTTEWRANLGYIALLNLFFGVGIWLYLIVR